MRCPHCRHSDGLHSGPGEHGRAADGGLLAPDYECGRCDHSTRNDDGTWTRCACPGWYPGLTAMQMTAATIAARAARSELAEVPFALTPPVARQRRPAQGDLF